MIKALILDFYNVLVQYKAEGLRYDPFSFNFNEVFHTNTELLSLIKDNGLKTYVLTNMSMHSAAAALDPDLMNFLQGIPLYDAPQMGLDKRSSYTYEFIARNKIGIKVEEAAFTDDSQDNIEAAQNAGMQTFLFPEVINGDFKKANQALENWLKKLVAG